jgi:hypothetical protein
MPQINAQISDDIGRRIRALTTRYQRPSGSDSQHRAAFVRAALKHFLDSPELRLHGLQKRISRLEIGTSERLDALEAAVKALRAQAEARQKAQGSK